MLFENTDIFPAEPVSATSGLALCVFAVLGPPNNAHKIDMPLEFWLARASLFACGIGTFVFHAVSDQNVAKYNINRSMWDYVTMMMVATNTLFLYFAISTCAKKTLALLYVAVMLFAVYSNDYLSGAWLWRRTDGAISWGVQFPLFIACYVVMLIHIKDATRREKMPLALAVSVACTAWILERFACSYATCLAHSVWHVAIGYASVLFICFGLRVRQYSLVGVWWPDIGEAIPLLCVQPY